jgi:hypothetical protein
MKNTFRNLALTNEEIEGMNEDGIKIHIRENITSAMPWWLDWFGANKKKVILWTLGFAIVIFVIILANTQDLQQSLITFFGGFGSFIIAFISFTWIIILSGFSMLVAGLLILDYFMPKDIVELYDKTNDNHKEYEFIQTTSGNALKVKRKSTFGQLIFGSAKVYIDGVTWDYILQNARTHTYKRVRGKDIRTRVLPLLPTQYRLGRIFLRDKETKDLMLNAGCLIPQSDLDELDETNRGKTQVKKTINEKIVFKAVSRAHLLRKKVIKLETHIDNVGDDVLLEFANERCPNFTDSYFDTQKFYEGLYDDRKDDSDSQKELLTLSENQKGDET